MEIPPYSNIFAFDPGLSYTGMGTAQNGAFATWTVTPSPKKYGFEKLVDMADQITHVIPDRCVVIAEDYAYGGRFMNVLVAELMGVIKKDLISRKAIWFITFAPTTIKKVATGSGKATKSQVKKAMKTTATGLGLTLDDSHQADALAILHTYFKYISGGLDPKTTRAIDGRVWKIGGSPKVRLDKLIHGNKK